MSEVRDAICTFDTAKSFKWSNKMHRFDKDRWYVSLCNSVVLPLIMGPIMSMHSGNATGDDVDIFLSERDFKNNVFEISFF